MLASCATPIDNEPLNVRNSESDRVQASAPRDIVDTHVVALSLSGGGMRAAAFGFGVMQALAETPVPASGTGTGNASGTPAGPRDLFDDLTFMSSVSGGSLPAAYMALNGRGGLARFRSQVLERNLERDLRTSLFSLVNVGRLLAGGLNDRSNLAATLDADVFGGATFADLYRNRKPDVWINATDLFNRTPFPFIPPVFEGLCSDLTRLRVSEAVAASMAVPLAFAPVVLESFPQACLRPLPAWTAPGSGEGGSTAADLLTSTARAIRRYRDPARMRYVKLADGGLTDNQGLASILVARAVSGNDYGPLAEADAVRLRRMLFLVVDAGRPPTGDWALTRDGPSGVDVALAAADAAIDSATRLSAIAFRTMFEEWRQSIIKHRCSLPIERVRLWLPAGESWDCADVRFYLDVVGFERLEPAQAERLRQMPTRLALSAQDIEAAVGAGRDAALASPALARYLAERVPRPSP